MAILLLAVVLSMGLVLLFESFQGIPLTSQKKDTILKKQIRPIKMLKIRTRKKLQELWLTGTSSITFPIYRSALKEDGTYDFHENFEYVKPWLKQADLILGDFEVL